MNNKPEIVFTFPACMGGVSSFNYNIINYSKLIEQYKSKVILLREDEDTRPLFTDEFNANEVVTFHYSNKENQYYVQQRLAALLGNEKGVVVTDNAITILAARRFNNPKTVFHLLHDYFYVNQNVGLGDMIDVAIAHSSFFSDAVYASNPELFAGRTFYIPYGVKQLPAMPVKNDETLNLVFLGRLDEGKGVQLLYNIDDRLQQNNVAVNWTIIGKGHLKAQLLEQWKDKNNVNFYEPAGVEDVYELLSKQDIFVFPTNFEGTPVSIIECLANGVVTIANDLPGGIRDIVKDGIGFRCGLNDLEQFADNIITLNSNRHLLRSMQENCFKLSHDQYDILTNADNYFRCFQNYKQFKRASKQSVSTMSRLDKESIPNFLVKLIRSIR